MRTNVMRTLATALFIVLATLCGTMDSAKAQKSGKGLLVAGRAADINAGGRLYDNHWSIIEIEPPSTLNPLYPNKVQTPSLSTWRCVTCHGWDYAGRKGHLKNTAGSETFRSLTNMVGRPPGEIVLKLKGSHQAIVAPLSIAQLRKLALFVSHGQYNVSLVMTPTGVAIGNALYGKDIYGSACVGCHGLKGLEPIMGETGDRSSLGWIARNRPQQAVHKIRNGVSKADMLSLRFLDLSSIGDLLAYLQSMDRK